MHVDTQFPQTVVNSLSIIFIKLNIYTIKSSKTYHILSITMKKKLILLRNYFIHLSLSRIQDN